MFEKRRSATGWLGCQGILLAMVLLLLLSALSGCGSGQSDVGQTNGNSVPVNLNISMPQESAAASTSGSRFWTKLQSWLPSLSNAWAQNITPQLVALTVEVTGPGLDPPITKREGLSNPQSGQTVTFNLDVPVGSDRVFTVSGLNGSGRAILQGKSRPIELIVGKAETVDITLADVDQPTISDPASLPIGVVGTAYSATLTATGGTPPYTWSVTPPLPARLTLAPAGSTATISGTPQAGTIGTTNHTFSVTDSSSPTRETGTRNYSVTIAPPGLSITTPSLPNGTVARPYSATVAASGGTPPYSWSIVRGLTPAPGLSLSPSGPTAGQISGTPSTNEGTPFTRTYQVQDSSIPPRTATKSLSIAVNLPSPPNITTQTLPNGAFRQLYNQTLRVSGGTSPFVWRFTGALPTGLSLNPQTAVIAGTAGATGTFNFTANVTDATGQTDSSPPALSITITQPTPPIITTPSPLPTGTVNEPYPATTLTATGGAPPLTWDPVVTPPLPNGLMFDPNSATISGTPLSASRPTTHTFTVRDATAPSNQTGTKGLLLTINSDLTIETTSPLPSGTVGKYYNVALTASGGTSPYSWSIVGKDPRPAPGLSLCPIGSCPGNEGPAGWITGTPTTARTFTRTYRVQDSKGEAVTKDLALDVTTSPLTIDTSMLPPGTCNSRYIGVLSASGGTGPGTYTWSIDEKDEAENPLPPAPGLSLSSSGLTAGWITGNPTPTRYRDEFRRTYRVQDSNQTAVTMPLTISVSCPPLG